jgi:signal transduction histidine kinase
VTTYLTIISLVNFLAASLLAFAVVLRGRSNELNRKFGIFALCVGLWSAGYFLWQIAEDADRALFFVRVLMFPAYFIPVTYLHFVTRLCGEQRPWLIRAGYLVGLVFSALNLTPLMVREVLPAMDMPFWPRAGGLFIVYLGFFSCYMFEALFLLQRHARQSTGARSSLMRYTFIATLIGFSGGATNFPLWYGISMPPLGNALVLIYLVTVAHAVSRYQLPLVTYDFVHAAIYVGLSVTFAIIVLLGCVMVAPLLDLRLSSANLLNIFLLGMVVSLFFQWAVPRLKVGVDRLLQQTYLRRRNTQQLRLKELGHRIVALGSEQEIFENSVREIILAFNLTSAAVYARGEFDSDYQLRAHRGWAQCPPALPIDSVLIRTLQPRMAPLIMDGSEMELPPAVVAELETARAQLPFAAVVPIASDDFLSGLLLLGEREDGERYTEAELALLESTALQIAVTLRARQLERRASQTEKLISLGTLAAGLAHELRNPLVSIQTFSALLKERGTELDFQQEFSSVVQRDVNRIASIVENVAAFAESNKVSMTAVNLTEVLAAAAEIVRPELSRAQVGLVLPATEAPRVTANYSQLLQVFLNLMQNAAQAMEGRPESRLTVGFELRSDAPQPLICVTLTDNGPGIDPAMLPHIFEPFTTTKSMGVRRGKHGMGLGLAIVKRIVQHHHGEIHVTSAVGAGTTFRVYLPQMA